MDKRKIVIELAGEILERVTFIAAENQVSHEAFVERAVECFVEYILSEYENADRPLN